MTQSESKSSPVSARVAPDPKEKAVILASMGPLPPERLYRTADLSALSSHRSAQAHSRRAARANSANISEDLDRQTRTGCCYDDQALLDRSRYLKRGRY